MDIWMLVSFITHWALAWGTGSAIAADNVMSESKLTDKYEDFMIFAENDLADYYITTIDDSVNFPKVSPESHHVRTFSRSRE
jgi:hypothetical protein